MPNIPIRVHGIVDYAIGILLVASAFVLPYPDNPMKMIAVVFGAIILLYSAMTDYPLGLLRFVPFPIHRAADLFAGGGLAFAPLCGLWHPRGIVHRLGRSAHSDGIPDARPL
jgi:hypothetical protein